MEDPYENSKLQGTYDAENKKQNAENITGPASQLENTITNEIRTTESTGGAKGSYENKGNCPPLGYLLKEDFLGGRGYRKTDTKKKARRNKRLPSFITRSKEVSPKNTMSPHVPLCSLKLKSGLRLQFPSLKFRYLLLD